ncbi:MAG: hypothetical protein NTX25_01315 [Proteobacteria bacterium]|nr:hypothetical protein [Pseudomonadota bacterium]
MKTKIIQYFVMFGLIQLFTLSNLKAEVLQDKADLPSSPEKSNKNSSMHLLPSDWPAQIQLAARSDDDASYRNNLGKAEKRRQNSQKYQYWFLLPLGIPQYAEGYRGMGTAIAMGQITSLAIFFDRQQKISTNNRTAADLARNVTPAQAASNPFYMSYLNQNEKEVIAAQKEARYSMIAFFGLYAFSVYEALSDPFDSRKTALMRKQKKNQDQMREKNRDSDKDDDFDFTVDKDTASENIQPKIEHRPRVSFMILPSDAEHRAEMALTWQASFN